MTSSKAAGSNCPTTITYGCPYSIWTTLQKSQTYCSNSLRTKKTALHRDLAAFHTFALQGEHHTYSSLGDFKQGRTVCNYEISQPDVEHHAEGEGESDVIFLISLPPYHGRAICEILDKNEEVLLAIKLTARRNSARRRWLRRKLANAKRQFTRGDSGGKSISQLTLC